MAVHEPKNTGEAAGATVPLPPAKPVTPITDPVYPVPADVRDMPDWNPGPSAEQAAAHNRYSGS